jgi:ABC-type branched-subunit amino acid transport system ATPase component/ABC-type branched-subunit amino acid transport system permease subunit
MTTSWTRGRSAARAFTSWKPENAAGNRRLAALAALALALLLLWFVVLPSLYLIGVVTLAAIWYLLLAGLNMLMGNTGLFHLGQAALYGVGAYAAAILSTRYGLGMLACLPISVLAGALMAFLVAVPFARLRGHFLAMATLAFQAIFTEIVTQGTGLTGGASGILLDGVPSVFGMTITQVGLLACVLVSDILVFLVVRRVTSRRTGRALSGIKMDELMAESFAVNAARYKVAISTLNGAIAGLAGFWFFYYSGLADPSSFDVANSIFFVAALVIGGQGTRFGPILGVGVYYGMNLALANFPSEEGLLFGVVLIAVVMFTPGGLVGLISHAVRRLRTGGDGGVVEIERTPREVEIPSQPDWGSAASAASAAPLELERVTKAYGGLEVLKDVTFDIGEPGRVIGLIGPNGAGKTTLLNLITGVDQEYGGSIRVFGQATTGLRSREVAALGVARTFQTPRLLANATGVDNILLGMHRHIRTGLPSILLPSPESRRVDKTANTLARDLLASVGLSSAADREVGILAHGPRRVLEVARALASRPRLLVLDEPAAGLDEREVEWLMTVLRGVADVHQITVLLIDHNMNLVMKLCDEVLVLDRGILISRGSAETVGRDPEVQNAYLGRGVKV